MTCTDARDCPCPQCRVRVTRRWFLGAAGALGAGLLLPEVGTFTPTLTGGTQLPEGWVAAHEGVAVYRINHTMTADGFRAVMMEELQRAFESIYDDRKVEWKQVFMGRLR